MKLPLLHKRPYNGTALLYKARLRIWKEKGKFSQTVCPN